MSSSLESEDLENVQLVRMEDVQPSRERPCDDVYYDEVKEEELETCIVDDLEYDNECVVEGNDEDSNIGSMVSIQSEEVIGCDDGSAELIVPELLAPKEIVVEICNKPKKISTGPESWPTLEILPGGVINHLEKCDGDLTSIYSNTDSETDRENGGMMYACAKCSERFQYLFSLVKHVRSHELEQRKKMEPDLATLCAPTRVFNKKNYVPSIKPAKTRNVVLTKVGKKRVVKVPKKSKS